MSICEVTLWHAGSEFRLIALLIAELMERCLKLRLLMATISWLQESERKRSDRQPVATFIPLTTSFQGIRYVSVKARKYTLTQFASLSSHQSSNLPRNIHIWFVLIFWFGTFTREVTEQIRCKLCFFTRKKRNVAWLEVMGNEKKSNNMKANTHQWSPPSLLLLFCGVEMFPVGSQTNLIIRQNM